ncbi:MAG: hypothetical protein M1484_03355 [Patescibacteria group bacterium]|nr:hypothetical protein [Patescibacteria group bacterium]MCL5432099.1 hypothetical protein [Patescibacteria group bacterium]
MALRNQELFNFDSDIQKTSDFVAIAAETSGTIAILKGGAVRDQLWNYYHGTDFRPKDLDFFVVSNIHLVHRQLQDKGFNLVERRKRKGTPVFKYKSPLSGTDFELGTLIGRPKKYSQRDSLQDLLYIDAESTDLTIDALSLTLRPSKYSWDESEVNDPIGAMRDIKNGEIKTPHPATFFRAPDAMLKAVRLASQLDATLPIETLARLSEACSLVPKVPFKLIYKEAHRIVEFGGTDISQEVLHGTGIVDALFPGRTLDAADLFKQWFITDAPDYTIVMLKPDGVEKQLQIEVIKGLQELGLTLAARKRLKLEVPDIDKIYTNVRNEWLIPKIQAHLTSGESEAMIFLGDGSIQIARKFIGATALGERQAGGLRGKYSNDFIKNIAHSPDSQEELNRTAKVLFPTLPIANQDAE